MAKHGMRLAIIVGPIKTGCPAHFLFPKQAVRLAMCLVFSGELCDQVTVMRRAWLSCIDCKSCK